MNRLTVVSLFVLLPGLSFAEPESQPTPASGGAAPVSKTFWQTRNTEKQADSNNLKVVKSSQPQEKNQNLSARQAQPAQSKPVQDHSPVAQDHEIWVYDAWVVLKGDYDHDSYYSEFELGFDVDTRYSYAEVYARIFLGDGHLFREIHTTSVFHVHGDNSQDEFVINSELLEGFASNDYDLLIEIYDADTDELHDSYDHLNDNDLYLLPLESNEYEHSGSHGGQVVITTEHGGSAGLFSLLGLACIFLMRRKMPF
ncbi:choice-of-anchor H family protein [Planctobacterium marinum]|uniref:choice-of-anchor H family protein n=1 Tax=Planctobacterium marinum TaxID=1631968 RepID=UPI001E42B57D|nr:choice-of-anchor H family protein [Planctobacterium marinum]MCC2606831.1 choice-of-anchor H family protein [Planctobacterium marinum]